MTTSRPACAPRWWSPKGAAFRGLEAARPPYFHALSLSLPFSLSLLLAFAPLLPLPLILASVLPPFPACAPIHFNTSCLLTSPAP